MLTMLYWGQLSCDCCTRPNDVQHKFISGISSKAIANYIHSRLYPLLFIISVQYLFQDDFHENLLQCIVANSHRGSDFQCF